MCQSRARVETWPSVLRHGPRVDRVVLVMTESFSVATGLGWPCVATGLGWPCVATVFDVTTQFSQGGKSLDCYREFSIMTQNCGLLS